MRRANGALGSARAASTYYAYRSGALAARALPAPMAAGSARLLGLAFAEAMRGRRWLVASHLRRVQGPSLAGRALRRQVQLAFDSYARYWLEVFRLPSQSRADVVAAMTHEGLDHYRTAQAAGNGVILAIPHLGNWDFGGAWLGVQGGRVLAVAEPLEPPELFEWFASFRRALGVQIVPLGPEAGTTLLKALRTGETVGLICDRNLGSGGVEVEFFGERTLLPGGPATLALRTGAPILPVAVYFSGPRSHHTLVRPPVPVDRSGRLRDDVARLTRRIAVELEGLIRRAPEQWHLFQPNWPSDVKLQPLPRTSVPWRRA